MSLELFEGCVTGNLLLVDHCLQNGVNPNLYSTSSGGVALHFACRSNCISIVKLLLNAGASPHAKDSSNMMPLHFAAAAGAVASVEILLDMAARVDAMDLHGRQPLHLAAFGGHTRVAELLLKHGADINAADKQGNTPLMHAVRFHCHETVRLLLKSGATCDLSLFTRNLTNELQLVFRQHYLQNDLHQLVPQLRATADDTSNFWMCLPAELRQEIIDFAISDPWNKDVAIMSVQS